MSQDGKIKRKVWTREETVGFLACYNARKEEFLHSRKKKLAYQHVLEDMLDKSLTDESTTALALECKMRTLLTAYKAAKDNANSTGASPCLPPFMQEMDEIFGDKPIISNKHTLHLGRGPAEPLLDQVRYSPSKNNPAELLKPTCSRKRKACLEKYYEEKLKLRKIEGEKKATQRMEFHQNITQILKEKIRRDDELQNKKLQILEMLIKKS